MQGFATALIEDYSSQLPAEGLSFAQRIATAAERMDRLILDLLEYARLSRAQMQMEPLGLDQVLHTVTEALSGDVRRAGGELAIHVGTLTVMGNRALLTQVLTNLISNAFKFVPTGTTPRVQVSAEADRGRVRVWVADNGIGIAPENHQRIFGVFERLHGHESYPGTGIGLAIVRRAIERMGGAVGVVSEAGHGSRFWFELSEAQAGESR
jgi:signal transduction histidine kinase